MSESERERLYSMLAERAGVDRAIVERVVEGFEAQIIETLRENRDFMWPDMVRFRVVHIPATADRPGINPFTRQPVTIVGRPEHAKLRTTGPWLLARVTGRPVEGIDENGDPILD